VPRDAANAKTVLLAGNPAAPAVVAVASLADCRERDEEVKRELGVPPKP
jgi:hypothetical protein